MLLLEGLENVLTVTSQCGGRDNGLCGPGTEDEARAVFKAEREKHWGRLGLLPHQRACREYGLWHGGARPELKARLLLYEVASTEKLSTKSKHAVEVRLSWLIDCLKICDWFWIAF